MADYEVAEYVITSLDGSRHPALLARPGSGVIFDGEKKRWVLESNGNDSKIPLDEIYQACFHARDELLATANKYRTKMKQPILDPSTSHSWTEVEHCIQTACSGLEELSVKDKDMSGSLGKLKRAFRSLCRNAGAGQTFATLIPNDSFGFTSVLCGGLKVVFAGLRATGTYREEVYKTLEQLPYTLEDHAANLKIHDQDEEIHRRAAALYVAIFNLLNQILLWFVKDTRITGVKLLLDPLGFADKLRQYMAEVKTTAQRFETHATKLSRRMLDESVQLQYWTTYQFQEMLERQKIMEERLARADVLENLSPFLNNFMDALQQKAILGRATHSPKVLPNIDPEHILAHFLYDPDLVWNDCHDLIKRFDRLYRRSFDADRLGALQSDSRLRAWLAVDEPSLLLINGRAQERPDSEVSLYAAKLVRHFLERCEVRGGTDSSGVAVIPIAFFCGQHRHWQEDCNGSPEEAAMSLLLQLIDRGRDRFDTGALRQCYERTRPEDVQCISSSLGSLISGLGSNVFVILVLDGLRYFAQPIERRRTMRALISALLQIYRKQPRATLKFLFLSPTRSDFVEDLFGNDELLEIPRNLQGSTSPDRTRLRAIDDIQSTGFDNSS